MTQTAGFVLGWNVIAVHNMSKLCRIIGSENKTHKIPFLQVFCVVMWLQKFGKEQTVEKKAGNGPLCH